MDNQSPILVDEAGPIRYNWPEIKLLYVSGASCTDIARGLTKDCPDHTNRARSAIAQRCCRDGWPEIRDAGKKFMETRPINAKNHDSRFQPSLLQDGARMAANVFADRKNSYLERASSFVDKSSKLLDDREINNLEEAALAAQLFDPVHKIAKDVHGLNVKEPAAALQVNFLSDPGACRVVIDEDPTGD